MPAHAGQAGRPAPPSAEGIRTTRTDRARGRANVRGVFPVFGSISLVESRGEHEFRPHRHDGYEVIVVRRGVYRAELGGQSFRLTRGQGLVAKPGDTHRDFCQPPLVYFAVNFELSSGLEGDPARPGLFAPGVTPAMQIFRMDERRAWPLVRQILDESQAPDELTAHVQDALLLTFFWRLVRALPREAVSEAFLDLSSSRAFPAQLQRVFRANLSRPLDLPGMARLMGVSESSLSHKCRRLLGVTPAKAFLRCRMERAAMLLASTSLAVKEVAFELGFEDPFAFSRAFRRHFGKSPSEGRWARG